MNFQSPRSAGKYDLLLLEDDPYRHLHLEPNSSKIMSFLEMDDARRVLRFDSFSKVISSGFRIGWVTGPQPLVERMQLNQQVGCLHTSGLSQMILLKTLHSLGEVGLQKHIETVKEGYRSRRDLFCSLADKHLVGLAEWFVPKAGMFVWFKFKGIENAKELLQKKAVKQKVLLVPGADFMADDTKPSSFARASYSTATPEEMEEALKRLAALLREEIA